jgi:acetoin utilization protein AcuC
VNLPLYPYTGDDLYVESFKQVVPPLVRAFAPDVLVTQLGIDSYHSDPLTHLQLTTEGYIEAVRELARLGLPWLALGGGGYDVTAVARSWTLAYGVMLGIDWPDRLPSAFAQEHGAGRLRDEVSPQVPGHIKVEASRYVEETVEAIRQQIFPFHGLAR